MRQLKSSNNNNVIPAFDLPDATAANHTTLVVGVVSASTASLPLGMYRFWSDVDCQIVQGVTATNAHLDLTARQPEYFAVNGIVSAIAAVSGTLKITRV